MCVGCSDFVDDCWEGDCYNPNGGRFNMSSKFYLGDTLCIHLQEKYGCIMADDVDYMESPE
jgi:hypothetical protein